MFSKEFIKNQLKELNAPKDKPIIVHTSLRAIGKMQDGAKGLLTVFKEYFTEKGGSLIVPTHTWSNFYEKNDIFLDFNSNETCVGVFPNIALQDGTGVRTDNPTHSAVVFGDKFITDELIKAEPTALTPTAPNGVYGKLYDFDGCVLLVGVGQEKNTYIHAVEEMLCVPDRLSDLPMKMKVKYKDGEIKERDFCYMTERIGDVSIYFPKYEPAFRKHGAIKDGFIGNAKAQLCSARKIKEVMELIRAKSGGVELLSNEKPLDEKWY